MNHPQLTYLLELQSNLVRQAWNLERLQQFADRNGLSLTIVQDLLLDKARAVSFEEQIDRSVDPEFQTINRPI